MSEGVFRIADKRPARDGMTISRNTGLGTKTGVSFFSLGKNTSISRESYDSTAIYIAAEGKGDFIVGEPSVRCEMIEGSVLDSSACHSVRNGKRRRNYLYRNNHR